MRWGRSSRSEKTKLTARAVHWFWDEAGSAGPREFSLARAAGFETAVTTRPGVLFADHLAHLTALPRISVNGLFQSRGDVAALLSGVPTALQNRGRRLNVA